MAQWLSGLWCWIYHVCLGFKSFEWQNILHLDCHGLDWIPFDILRSKNKGWIDPMGLTFPRMDQSNELQFLQSDGFENNSRFRLSRAIRLTEVPLPHLRVVMQGSQMTHI